MSFDQKRLTGSIKQKLFLKALSNLNLGKLKLVTPEGSIYEFCGKGPGRQAQLNIHDWSIVNRLLKAGDIGFGESYMKGEWSSPDLPELLTFLLENIDSLSRFYYGNGVYAFFAKILHAFRLNSKRGSRRNISSHYDLGNEFYRLWLDPSLTYSSGIFQDNDETLLEAQNNKYENILNNLSSSSEAILEIGCGWGGFAEKASHSGFRVDAITISSEQAQFAKSRLKPYSKTHVLFKDYRELKKKYDSIVSIEMFEAVGEKYWPTYFKILKNSLNEKGRAVIQTITIDNKQFESYSTSVDFIQKHIFPGGMLPSFEVFSDLANKAGLTVIKSYEFGHSYYLTLKGWLSKFDDEQEKIKKQGFNNEFIRKWRFYLAYCMAGFATKRTQVYQLILCHTGDEHDLVQSAPMLKRTA